ncbi:10300_t:CDS:2, partial [Funneliformis geosporum]
MIRVFYRQVSKVDGSEVVTCYQKDVPKESKESPKTFRPALVISGNIQNELNDLIAVVPLTTDDIENIEPFEVYIKNTKETGLDKP